MAWKASSRSSRQLVKNGKEGKDSGVEGDGSNSQGCDLGGVAFDDSIAPGCSERNDADRDVPPETITSSSPFITPLCRCFGHNNSIINNVPQAELVDSVDARGGLTISFLSVSTIFNLAANAIAFTAVAKKAYEKLFEVAASHQ
ncbi:unnamed protein product [Rodentolepis nana]|uniref:Uncharacterized protein n=1 Tax=Rodentolepis nana TaxID=102285 RepID=A0A0R3TXS9_RODNA|nr:unnamed protein product [Rodentolepis nana]